MKRVEIVTEILRLNEMKTKSILNRDEKKINKYNKMLENVLKIYFKYNERFED